MNVLSPALTKKNIFFVVITIKILILAGFFIQSNFERTLVISFPKQITIKINDSKTFYPSAEELDSIIRDVQSEIEKIQVKSKAINEFNVNILISVNHRLNIEEISPAFEKAIRFHFNQAKNKNMANLEQEIEKYEKDLKFKEELKRNIDIYNNSSNITNPMSFWEYHNNSKREITAIKGLIVDSKNSLKKLSDFNLGEINILINEKTYKIRIFFAGFALLVFTLAVVALRNHLIRGGKESI